MSLQGGMVSLIFLERTMCFPTCEGLRFALADNALVRSFELSNVQLTKMAPDDADAFVVFAYRGEDFQWHVEAIRVSENEIIEQAAFLGWVSIKDDNRLADWVLTLKDWLNQHVGFLDMACSTYTRTVS